MPATLAGQSVSFTEYAIPSSSGGTFSQPTSITKGPDGALWFTEISANAIGRITSAGVITEYPIPTQLSIPDGITTGPDGALWFAENNGNKIGRITTAGVLTEYPLPAQSYPNCLVTGPDGALWYTDGAGAGKIGRMTTAGEVTQFVIYQISDNPYAITVGPDGAMWFTHGGFQEAGWIGRITTAGVISEYPIPYGNSTYGMAGITAGPDGALWFTNGDWIGRITTAGVVSEYPLPAYSQAIGITAGPDGALWFAESGFGKIGRISGVGAIIEYPAASSADVGTAAGESLYGIAMGPDGALWYAENIANKIGRALVSSHTNGNVTVTSSPVGLTVTVDGTSYSTPQSFNWAAGQSHSIGLVSPQGGSVGTRYAFAGWSDGGAQTHSVTAPSSATTYTATFTTQYLLTTSISPLAGGAISLSPLSADGFYSAGTSVQVAAAPNSGFQFSNWSSDLNGSANPQSFTMTGSSHVQANFKGPRQSISFSEYPIPTTSSFPGGIGAGPDGALWFTEEEANRIGRISTTGVITEYPVPTPESDPDEIVAGPDGALWFTETASNKIGRITTAGVVTEYSVPTPGSNPQQLTVGPDGALWFPERLGNNIARITTAGIISEYAVPTAGSHPEYIAAGPDGALWFTEAIGNQVGRITTSGQLTEYPIPTPNCLSAGITTGPDGALWFTELQGNKIGRITTAGAISEYSIPTPGSAPYGIVAAADGALWFAELFTNQIGRISTSGVITEYAVPSSSGGYSTGYSIAAGPDGGLWFTEAYANKIGRAVLPTGNACTYSLPQGGQAFSSAGGNGTAAVRAPAGGPNGCSYTAHSGASWVMITDGGSGRGNGTVSYTVAVNSSTVARTGTLTIADQTYTVTQAGLNSTPSCTGAVPLEPQVAIEGRTELLGDYLLSCTGLSSTLTADITLTLNVNVTNALAGGATDAVMTVNGVPIPQSGVVAGFNSIVWAGVSLAPAGNGTVSVRISKVRADASPLLTQRIVANPGNPQPTAITGLVSIGGAVAVLVSDAIQEMAKAVQTVVFTEQPANPGTGGSQTFLPMVFQEAQAGLFTAGVTRLYVSLSNVPATVQVYAPVSPNEGAGRAQLYSADANGVGGSPVTGSPFAGGMYQPLVASGGTVTATWALLTVDPAVIDTYTFPLLVVNAASGDLSQMQVAASLAPVSTVGVASAMAPVPRYRNLSVQPQLANLRVSTSVAVAGAAGLVKGNAKTQAGPVTGQEMPVPLIGTVGSNLTFTTVFVNDTNDPAQTATNVVIRDNLPTGLTLVSCTATGSVTCTGSGANVGMLGPGQGGTLTVVAAVGPSFTEGTVVENPVSASSDQVNLDLLASTSSSSFVVGPAALTSTPASGTGSTESFTFQFSDLAGYQNLSVVNVLINSVLDGRNACYLAYVVAAQTLYLVDDAGDAGGPYAGSVVLGSASTIHNSQCTVGLTSALGSGNTLTLTLNIAFAAGFGGNKVQFVAARDQGTGNTDWQALGVWQAPSTQTGAIAVTGVSPVHGAAAAGTSGQFTFTLTDGKGTGDFGVVNVLVNNYIDGRGACYLAYVASSETLVLVDDAGDAGGPWAGSMVLNGGSGAIENSQCAVSGTGSTVGYAPGVMTLTLNLTFKGGLSGNRVFYVAGRDQAGGSNTGWQAVGTWTVE